MSFSIFVINTSPDTYGARQHSLIIALLSFIFLSLLYNRAISNGSLLSPESKKSLFQPRVNWKEWDADYGYGWMLDRGIFDASTRHEIQYHPGTEPGFYAMMIRQPDKKITIILLNNKGEFPRFDIADLILNELN